MVEEFEKAFATFCEASYAVAISSGTDALRFALMASGVKPGDVVVTVPHTFIATTEAISQAGALPEFVDIDEQTYNMDPAKLAEYLEKQCTVDEAGTLVSRRSGRPVTAVVPVHLYGQMADMDPDPGTGRALSFDRDRRRLPGPRRRVFFAKAQSLDEGRIHGPGRRVQLLSREKSRRVRRGRRGHDERRRHREDHEDAPGSRPGHKVLSRRRRL